jgi:hypothetical protein
MRTGSHGNTKQLKSFRESLTPREQKKYAPEMDLTSSEKTGNTITKTSKKHRKIGVQRVRD